MGLVIDAIGRMPLSMVIPPKWRYLIEENIRRRQETLGQTMPSVPPIATIERNPATTRGASLKISINFEGLGVFLYCLKQAESNQEPGLAFWASDNQVGPHVLDVGNRGEGAFILEEFLSPADRLTGWNQVAKRIGGADPKGFWGKHMVRFFVKFIDVPGNWVINHDDPKAAHYFLVGSGLETHVRLIDWGRAKQYSLISEPGKLGFEHWAKTHFSRFFEFLAFSDPVIWRIFLEEVNAKLDRLGLLDQAKAAYNQALPWPA